MFVPQIVILLLILLACEWIVKDKKYLSNNFYLLLNIIVMFLAYWVYTAWLFAEHVIRTHTKPTYFEHLIIKSNIQAGNELSFLLTNCDSFLFILFAIIGIGYIFWKGKPIYASVFGLFALIILVLYIPNPLQILWQTMTLFRFDRFMLLISPFMAFVMGWGIYIFCNYLIPSNSVPIGVHDPLPVRKKVSRILPICTVMFLVGMFAFTSTATDLNASDCVDLWREGRITRYFTNADLSTFDFIERTVPNNSSIYSDVLGARYFVAEKYFENSSKLGLKYYKSSIIYSPGLLHTYKGYIVYRRSEFSERKCLYFGSGFYTTYEYRYTPENVETLEEILSKLNKPYSNGEVEILWVR